MTRWRLIHQQPQYSISSKGKIRNNTSKHIKSTRLDRYGYPRVTLYPSGKTFTIHRLIMTNFTPKESWKEQINHKDSVRKNSVLSNLEWVTPKENSQHMILNNRQADVNGSKNPMAKLTDKIVSYIRCFLIDYPVAEVAEIYGVSITTIERVRSGDSWKNI